MLDLNSNTNLGCIQNEIKLMRNLKHEHLVSFFGTFQLENDLFLVAEHFNVILGFKFVRPVLFLENWKNYFNNEKKDEDVK